MGVTFFVFRMILVVLEVVILLPLIFPDKEAVVIENGSTLSVEDDSSSVLSCASLISLSKGLWRSLDLTVSMVEGEVLMTHRT